jgi:hypothetical protein
MKLTLEQLRRGKHLDLKGCLRMVRTPTLPKTIFHFIITTCFATLMCSVAPQNTIFCFHS